MTAALVLTLLGSYVSLPLYAVPVARLVPPQLVEHFGRRTLLGADVSNLPRIYELGAPMVSIGGAGTFDGVFLLGIVAAVLAAWVAPRRHADSPGGVAQPRPIA